MTCLAPVDLNAYWEAYHQIEKEMNPIVEFVRQASAKELDDYELKEWYPKGVRLPLNANRGYVGLSLTTSAVGPKPGEMAFHNKRDSLVGSGDWLHSGGWTSSHGTEGLVG